MHADPVGLGPGLRFFPRAPSNADAAGPWTTLGVPGMEGTALRPTDNRDDNQAV